MWRSRITALLLVLTTGNAFVMGATWHQSTVLFANDPAGNTSGHFGNAVATNGHAIVVGAAADNDMGSSAGAAYIFEKNQVGTWSQTAKLYAGDPRVAATFGHSVAVDSNTAVVTSLLPGDLGEAYVFEKQTSGDWIQTGKVVPVGIGMSNEFFGADVALRGNTLVVSSSELELEESNGFPFYKWTRDSGAAYVFERDTAGAWNQVARLASPTTAPLDRFARQVTTDGNSIAISAIDPGEPFLNTREMGLGHIYRRNANGDWALHSTAGPMPYTATLSGVNSIAIEGSRLVVGGTGTTIADWTRDEVAFYRETNSTWELESQLESSLDSPRGFGASFVALSGGVGIATTPWGPDTVPGGVTDGGVSIFEFNDENGWSEVTAVRVDDAYFRGEVAISGQVAVAAQLYGAGVHVFEPVPEPSSLTFIAVVLLILAFARKR